MEPAFHPASTFVASHSCTFITLRNNNCKTPIVKRYDYIISGAGAAGLSLLMRLMIQGGLNNKQILVIDKEPKTSNDRTWCFWEQAPGMFEPIVHHSWQQMHFYSAYFSSLLSLFPYKYKMIRGIDFYNFVMAEAEKFSNITFQYGNVEAFANEGDGASVIVDGTRFTADYVFNSILLSRPAVPADKYYLLQHFKGWMIETPEPAFDMEVATLMDFRVSQQKGTTFVYVLPVANNKALVEYTLFTKELLPADAYDVALKDYIASYLRLNEYTVTETEFGIIPMTNMKFLKGEGSIVNIGTAGGQTKASSGYTFRFIQKQSDAIIEALLKNVHPQVPEKLLNKRFNLYDSTLLNILHHNKMGGDKIFADLFSKNEPARVLRFLDNESSLEDEINIMHSVPSGIFMKAAFQEIFR